MSAEKTYMNALVLMAPNEFEIQQVPVPEPETDEVICKVGHHLYLRYGYSHCARRLPWILATVLPAHSRPRMVWNGR